MVDLYILLSSLFNCPSFLKNLEFQIQKWKNKLKGSRSIKGQFLRSATFDYRHFIECFRLKIVFLLRRKELSKYKRFISSGFYNFLIKNAKDE